MRTLTMILFSLSMTFGACDNPPEEVTPSKSDLSTQIYLELTKPLSELEESALLRMREEEKLARDVYLALYDRWGAKPLVNISSAEQKHMDAVLGLIQKYGLTDPVGDDVRGEFVDADLQSLYDELTAQGAISLEEAFIVGAIIEEIDLMDLMNALATDIDHQDIERVFENLMRGSRNHLRSFVSNLNKLGITYTPQYLSQANYDLIIEADMEQGNRNGGRNGRSN